MVNQNYKHSLNKLMFLLIICGSFYLAPAQDLTKEETVNYINKKLVEAIDFGIYDEKDGYLLNQKFSVKGDFIEFTLKRANSKKDCYSSHKYEGKNRIVLLKPKHIKEIEEMSVDSNQTIGLMKVSFLPKLVKYEDSQTIGSHTKKTKRVYWYTDIWGTRHYADEDNGYTTDCNTTNETGTMNWITLYYIKEEANSGSKLIKALNHLIDLYKAEDDPFGN